jgi:hypothetical protein
MGGMYTYDTILTRTVMRSQASRHFSCVLLRVNQVIVHIVPCLYLFLSTFYIQIVLLYRTTILPELGTIVSRP